MESAAVQQWSLLQSASQSLRQSLSVKAPARQQTIRQQMPEVTAMTQCSKNELRTPASNAAAVTLTIPCHRQSWYNDGHKVVIALLYNT
jgi:hypothetical protein